MKKWIETVQNQLGQPVAGASLTVYKTGTSTLAQLYSDNGVTTTANPVVTDTYGTASFYVEDGRYDLTVSGTGIGTRTLSDVEILDNNGLGIYRVDLLATGGTGTQANPWTGWDTALAALSGNVRAIFPAGYFSHSGVINLSTAASMKSNWILEGNGKDATIITSSHTGSGFFAGYTVNGSTAARIILRDLTLINSNGSNTGCGFDQVAGTFVKLQDVKIQGFKYGVVFDQTELGDILDCDFELNITAGVWLVNNAEHTSGALGQATNRIGIQRCQFNGATYGVIDDGGTSHGIRDCNFNGGSYGIWAVNTVNLHVENSEFEGMTTNCVKLTNLTAQGGLSIGGGAVTLLNNTFTPGPTVQPLTAASCLLLVMINNYFSRNGTVLTGTANINALHAEGNYNDYNTSFFDSTATIHTALTNRPNGGTVTNVFKQPTTFSNGATISAGGLTVSAGGASITGNQTLSGTMTSYDGITTAGLGLTPIVATLALTAQAASIGSTNLLANAPAGQYRVHISQQITQAATTSSSIQTTIGWNNGSAKTTSTAADTTNLLNAELGGDFVIHVASTSNITYATTYASVGGTAMNYAIYITLERLQ